MNLFKRFIKLMKSEPCKKSFKWTIGENKIVTIADVDRIRNTCLKLKREGTRLRKFFLVRDWFMIELGLFTGLRVDEMRQLKVGDLLINENQSSVFIHKGKGGRKRSVWINTEFKKICQDFLTLKKSFGLGNEKDCFLFTSGEGTLLTKRALQKSFKRCIRKAHLSEKYSIHCLRHTYGTSLLKASRNIKLVKEQLGHSSIKTTEIYISLINEDRQKALERLYQSREPLQTKPKRKGRSRIQHISCEMLAPGSLKRRSYKDITDAPEDRWVEVVEICEKIMTKYDLKKIP